MKGIHKNVNIYPLWVMCIMTRVALISEYPSIKKVIFSLILKHDPRNQIWHQC